MKAKRQIIIVLIVAALRFPLAVTAGITLETLSLQNNARPGDSYAAMFSVRNSDSLPCDVAVYQTDYNFACDGSNQFGEPGTEDRSNATWITFSPHRFVIPPRDATTVNCIVNVPADTSLVGTYWSILMVEEKPDIPEKNAFVLRKGQAGLRQVVRYGVQCVTEVGTGGSDSLKILDARIIAEVDTAKELQVDVGNTGQRWALPIAWTEIYDMAGKRIGRFETASKRIFPGTSARFRISIGNLPAGWYKAFVVVDNGNQNIIGAKYDLEF